VWSLGLAATAVPAAELLWQLTTADFHSDRVVLQSIDPQSGVSVLNEAGQQPRTIGLDRLLVIQRIGPSSPPVATAGSRFALEMAGGDRLIGQPAAIEGENLIWQSPALGRFSVPLRSVISILRSNVEVQPSPAQTDDVVTLQNGDSLHGIIAGIEGSAIVVQQTGGEKAAAPLDSVSRVIFAVTSAPATAGSRPAARQSRFRIGLADGSAITVARVQLSPAAGSNLILGVPDGSTRPVPMSIVTRVEQVDGPVIWLSTITPTELIQRPFLELAWPIRMDRASDGGPIRFGDHVYTRGIGAHSYSKLTFPIDPAYKTFRTQYAIAGDWPYADVVVRIMLDDRVVHEQKDFHCGVLASPVLIELAGHQQITLEVDYGRNYDVQDRFNWIEPAFLK
jgi:hypothetical protein